MEKQQGVTKCMWESGSLEILSSRMNDFIYESQNQSQVM